MNMYHHCIMIVNVYCHCIIYVVARVGVKKKVFAIQQIAWVYGHSNYNSI